jgi:photosystem II stability/assembly factor-like uncharacterized protein
MACAGNLHPPAGVVRMIHPVARRTSAFIAATNLALLLSGAACAQQPSTASFQPYVWKNVVIRGGGFVDGIIFSTAQKGLVYARTDVGGAYRSDNAGEHWVPITDFVDRKNSSFTGIESLALDPNDPGKVYVAAGLYTADWWKGPSAIMRSSNKGRTWQGTIMPFKMGGNDDGRNCGERLAVDPNLGSILYFGSRRAGLWQSKDSGANWTHVDSFPIKDLVPEPWQKAGITFVLFDRASGAKGKATPGIYIGVAQMPTATASNLYHSSDGGATWTAVPGTPKTMFPSHAVLNPSGQIYFTFINNVGPNDISDGAILKFSSAAGKWDDISPVKPGADGHKFGFGGIALDREHPDTVMVTTLDRWWPADSMYRSTDAGKHWKEINLDSASFSASSVPWVYWHRDKTGGTGWMNDIAIDPFNSDKVMYTTGEGIWGSADVTANDHDKPTHWGFPNEGLEETVPIALISPPEGAHLVSGVGDIGGFRHDDLDKSPADGFFANPQFTNTDSLDFAAQKPLTLVRVGRGDKNIVHGAWSSDGGSKWTPFGAEAPTSKWGAGTVAIAADASVIVWTPERGNAYRSGDMGKTWTACAGLPDQARVISDRIDPKRFYSFDPATGNLLRSTDGALTFAASADTPAAPPSHDFSLVAAPGAAGDLWLAAGDKGLHSTDFGTTFTPVDTLARIYTLGFGKAAPGATYSALYAVGADAKADGFFRSDDAGKTWVRIDDPAHQYGWIRTLTGDPRVYGRVYLATGGRGIIYGDIAQRDAPSTTAVSSR